MKRIARMFKAALLAPPDDRLLQRSFLAFVVSFAGAMASIVLGIGLLELAGIPSSELDEPDLGAGWVAFVGGVLVAPAVETLLLAAMLALMPRRWSIPSRALATGVFWGVLHGLAAPFWFVGTWFPFFVFSCCWMTWRQRSFGHAFAAATLPHALQNLVALSPLLLAG